jgi:hypothetical protein
MIITDIKHIEDIDGNKEGIQCVIDGVPSSVPLDPANTDYQAILEWAKIDGNTIADAD